MPISVDELQIELNAKAASANDAIDKLVVKLDKLSTSLGKINGSAINGLANSVDRLGRSMQVVNSIDTRSFTKLANNIQTLGNINAYNLNTSASALSNMTKAFSQLGNVSQNAAQVGELSKNLGKLGNKSVVEATKNIPSLATSLNHLMTVLSKSPKVNQDVISLVNSLSKLSSQGSKVRSSSNSVVSGLFRISSASEKATKSTTSLASAFGTLYANFFWVIRGIKGVWASIGETSDYIESFNYYTVAFDKIASEWDEKYESYGTENAKKYTNAFVTEMSDNFEKLSGLKLNLSDDLESGILSDTGMKNLGLNLKEVTTYASQLASVTNSVGQTGEVSLMTADAFTKLAGDMSSLFNVDFSTVAKNLQSGLIGQSRALYKYGIDITNATLQTYAYQHGVEKAVSEMTQMEKMQLRMLAILDQSKVAWGDLADTINTPANMIRQLSNNFKEASMVLGQMFVPLLTKVLPFINGVVIAMKNLFSTIAGFMGIKISLDSVGQGAYDAGDDVDGMTDSLENATSAAKKLKSVALGIDELNINEPKEDSGSDKLGGLGGSIDLSDAIEDATAEYQRAWEEAYAKMENKAQAFAKNVEKALKPISDMFYHFSVGDFFSAGQDVSNLVLSITNFFSKAISETDWDVVGQKIGDFLAGIEWSKIIKSGLKLKFDLAKAAADIWLEGFSVAPLEMGLISAVGIAKFTLLSAKLGNGIIDGVVDFIAGYKGMDEEVEKAFRKSLKTSIGITGLKIALPVVVSVTSLAFEYKVGKEREELEKEIEKLGEEEGRKAAGTGFFDKQALYRHDVEKTNNAITQSYLDMFATIGEKMNVHQLNVESTNASINLSYLELFSGIDETIKTHQLNVEGTNNLMNQAYVTLFSNIGEKVKTFFADWSSKVETHKKNAELANAEINKSYVETFSKIGNALGDWWENDVKPLFDLSTWRTFGENIKQGISEKWTALQTWFENTALYKFFQNVGQNFQNASLSQLFPTFSAIAPPAFATGGFPEDGLFYANHNELVGKFSNGRTAVANNEQIISGIEQGVERAVANILAPYLAEIVQNTRETADKDFATYIGDREIARANARGQRSMGYTLITEG